MTKITTNSKDYERALFALGKLPHTITEGLSHDIDATKQQLEKTLTDITKKHAVLDNIISHTQQEYKLLRQELVHLSELKSLVSETLYELFVIINSTELVSYLQKKKTQIDAITALQKSIAFAKYNKEITQNYETAKLLYAGNTELIGELDSIYKDAEQKFTSNLQEDIALQDDRKNILSAYKKLLQTRQIQELIGPTGVDETLVLPEDTDAPQESPISVVAEENSNDDGEEYLLDEDKNIELLPTVDEVSEASIVSQIEKLGGETKRSTQDSLEENLKNSKTRHRRGPNKNLNYLSTSGITEYKIKKQREAIHHEINKFKNAHKPLFAIAKIVERLKANKDGRYDLDSEILSIPTTGTLSKMNISITKGDISEVNKLIKLRKLASDVSLLHNCLPVIDMKNDDGTYAMQHRENKLKELDADRNSVLKAQKKDRPSINIARIRSLKKMTEGVLNINTKLNAKKLSLIILKLTNAINLAHKDISPKARANPDFHFSAQEAHITRISEIVEEIMDDFIAAHVDNTNGLLKIVSYTNLVCRIIEETVMQNANSTKDEGLISCTSRIMSQVSLMLEGELYKSYGEKFNTQEFELLERLHVHGRLIGDGNVEGYASGWLAPIYATLNTISQRINTHKMVYDTFDIENEEIGEEGRKMIAQRYASQFESFSVKSKMYSAPEVISRGYGVKNVEHLFWLKEIPNSSYAGMLLLGDIDIFINVEARDQKLVELCAKTGDDQETIEYYTSPLPFVRNLHMERAPSYDIVTRGKAGALFLHKNGDLSLDYEDVEDLKYILGKDTKGEDIGKDTIDSKAYYMLQAYILYHILESHNIIDKRKDHPVFWGPRLHTVERESKDIMRKDPRVMYNAPVARDSGITRNVQYRSETFVRHYKKDMFTAEEFIESLHEKKFMKAGVYRINDHGDPYYEELSFDLNRLPLPSEINDLLDTETRAWTKSIITDVQGYIQDAGAFIKLQSLIKKTVEAGRLGCAFYIKYYRSEHKKPGAKKTPKTIYQIFGKSIEKKPSETETASIERLIHRQPTYVQNLFRSLKNKIGTGQFSEFNIQRRSHSNQIHCIKDKEPLFTLSLANFMVAHMYIDLPEEQDNIIILKDENSITELLTLLQNYGTNK